MTGFSIRVFLPDGEPDGLRLVDKSHWTGRGLMTRRDRLSEDIKRDEFKRSGVYVLLGPGEEGLSASRIYIGEGNVVSDRIREHVQKKDFWNELVLFTKKDDSLDKADISHLEAELLKLTKQAGRAELDNTQMSEPPSPTEAKSADIESFLQDMLVIFRLLGIDAFDPIRKLSESPGSDIESESYMCTLKGVEGYGTRTRNGFLVQEGSRGNATDRPSISKIVKDRRKRLLDDGIVEKDGKDLIFQKDYEFQSPSAAASALYGGSANGRTAWKLITEGEPGKSLKEIEAEQLEEIE